MSRRVRLSRHPQSTAAPALDIEVEVTRGTSLLNLVYVARGDVNAISLPKAAVPARADGLWQHTCFEAFIAGVQSAAYWEFNFSPSREWAAYRFEGYRQGMANETAIGDPQIDVRMQESELRLSATLDLSGAVALDGREEWRLGLSAVIEDESGGKSYWALAHPPGKPDFHHADSFALYLAR